MTSADRSTRGIDYQDVPRPVAALADEYPADFVDPWHHHKRAQLLYGSVGVMSVTTEEVSVVVPPYRALWVPAMVEHEVRCRSHVSVRTLYVDPGARPNLPASCRVLEVSTLFRELLIEATAIPVEYDQSGRDGRVMELRRDHFDSGDAAAHSHAAQRPPAGSLPRTTFQPGPEAPPTGRRPRAWAIAPSPATSARKPA